MKLHPWLFFCWVLAWPGPGGWLRGADAVAAPGDPAASVIILANSADEDSLDIARHYAARRGVPMTNIISLRLSTAETISRGEFETTLYQPLQDELVRRKWMDAMELTTARPTPSDPGGIRGKYLILRHHISYLVVCRGVPLRVEPDASRPPDSKIVQPKAALGNNGAAVDSELAMLPQSGWPLSGSVPNPLFHNDYPLALHETQVVKVGRLDGPTAEAARGLVDLALTAETTGLIGRGYVDLGGPFAEGDKWLAAAAKELDTLGFDADVDREPATLAPEARFDAPVLYFGWYASAINGPFARAGFRFPPGAVALHIYSYSASTLHGAGDTWVPGLVARGVTGTLGNVTEPYLQFTHQPQLVLHALARGDTLGDAAAYAIPGYSWMGILIGDPLYRPFKVPWADQWRDRAKLPPDQQPYVVLRQMHLQEAAGHQAEALAIGQETQAAGFTAPVALTLAELQRTAGDKEAAKLTLLPFLSPEKNSRPVEPALVVAAARQLEALGEPKLALELWRQVLARNPPAAWLKPAIAVARAAKDNAQVARWEEALTALTAPAVSPK